MWDGLLPGVCGALQGAVDQRHHQEQQQQQQQVAAQPHGLQPGQRRPGPPAWWSRPHPVSPAQRGASGGPAGGEGGGAAGHLEPAGLLQRQGQQPGSQGGGVHDPPGEPVSIFTSTCAEHWLCLSVCLSICQYVGSWQVTLFWTDCQSDVYRLILGGSRVVLEWFSCSSVVVWAVQGGSEVVLGGSRVVLVVFSRGFQVALRWS